MYRHTFLQKTNLVNRRARTAGWARDWFKNDPHGDQKHIIDFVWPNSHQNVVHTLKRH